MVEFETKVIINKDYRNFGDSFDTIQELKKDFKTKEELFEFIKDSVTERFEQKYPDLDYEIDEDGLKKQIDEVWKND